MGSSGLRENNTPLPSNGKTTVFGGPHDFRLTILYPSILRLNRVETVRVELSPTDPVDRALDLKQKEENTLLPVRLSIAGAMVFPSETAAEISPFASTQASFRVTALASGDFPDACLEVTRDGKTETIALPMRSQGNAWLAGLAALILLFPLLLYFPSQCPQWSGGAIERGLIAWLPRLPLAPEIAFFVQEAFTWLATVGAELHLSFFALVAMVMFAAMICVSRSPRPVIVRGPRFTLGPAPRPIDPPKYLTPVSELEISVTRPA